MRAETDSMKKAEVEGFGKFNGRSDHSIEPGS